MNKYQNRTRNWNWKQTAKTVETQTECETESESGNDADIEFIRKIPLHPRERLKRKQEAAKFKYSWFIFQMAKQVFLTNYKKMYGIDEKDEILNSLVQQNAKDYYTYKRICELAVESSVVSSEKWFYVEIDAEQNQKLLTKLLSNWQVEKKVGHGYEFSNLYRIIRVLKWTDLFF